MDNLTSSANSASVLTIEDIKRAVKMLKAKSKEPFIVNLSSRLEGIELLRQSSLARDFSFHMGLPVIEDPNLPADIFRFHLSDGTFEDYHIVNKIKFVTNLKK